MAQLRRRFTDSQVKELIERYFRNEIQREYIQEILGIRKTRFFALKTKKGDARRSPKIEDPALSSELNHKTSQKE